MKETHIRIYEIEYIEKIEKLMQAGVDKSTSGVCRKACLEGIDVMFDRVFNKSSQVAISEKLDDISEKLTMYAKNIKKDVRENMLVGYSLRQLIATIYNILLVRFRDGVIDEQSLELGMYDEIPERILELFENMANE